MLFSALSGEIEASIDDVAWGEKEGLDVYQLLSDRAAPPSVGGSITARFTPYLDELRAIRPGCDPQLWEGYRKWSREDINRLVKYVQAIVDDSGRYASNGRVSRLMRPRLPRQINAAKRVKSLKYLKEFAELRLVSLDPVRVVGAASLWTYDTRRRVLSHFVSGSRSGFDVSGTTLKRVDKDSSVCKILRRPEETLSRLLSASKTGARAVLDELTTKPAVPSPRLNDRTVLMRIT